MGRTITALAFLAALAACSAGAPATELNVPTDIAAVNAVRAGFVTAYNAGDIAAMSRLYTADAISEPDHQPTLRGRDAIVASQKAMFDQATMKIELTPEETQTSGRAGFDRGHYTAVVSPKDGGPTRTVEGRYLVLLVKENDGVWRVSRDMDNAVVTTSAPVVDAVPAPAK